MSNLWQLVRDYRRHVPGSRLRARMVSLLVLVAVTPLVGVYIFSVEFINRGIDNWFSVDVEQGLSDALELGQTALDIQTRAQARRRCSELARRLAIGDRAPSCLSTLNAMRRDSRCARAHRVRPEQPDPRDRPRSTRARRVPQLSDGRGAVPAAPGSGPYVERRAAEGRPVPGLAAAHDQGADGARRARVRAWPPTRSSSASARSRTTCRQATTSSASARSCARR